MFRPFYKTIIGHSHIIILQKKESYFFFLNFMAVPDDGSVKNLKHVASFRQMFLSKNTCIVVSDVTPVYSSDLLHYTVYGTSGYDKRQNVSPFVGLFT
jgi:hypothetical protein